MTQTKTQLPATTSAPLRRSRWNTHTTHVTCSSGTNALRSTSNRPGKPTLVRAGLSETPVDTSIDTNAAPTSKAVQLIQPCQRTDHLRWVQVRPERSQENRPDPRKKSAAPPFTPAFLDLIVATPSSTNTTLAGVAQSVERVALITAKRSTSRSWVRAPPSAIPIISSSSEQLFFCSFGGILIGGDCMFLESRRAVVGVVASRCELSRFLGPGRK